MPETAKQGSSNLGANLPQKHNMCASLFLYGIGQWLLANPRIPKSLQLSFQQWRHQHNTGKPKQLIFKFRANSYNGDIATTLASWSSHILYFELLIGVAMCKDAMH